MLAKDSLFDHKIGESAGRKVIENCQAAQSEILLRWICSELYGKSLSVGRIGRRHLTAAISAKCRRINLNFLTSFFFLPFSRFLKMSRISFFLF